MTELTETLGAGGFIVSEAAGTRSREQVTLLSGQVAVAGSVLGKVTKLTTAPTSAPFAGNTGNGVMGAITSSTGSKAGVYKLRIVELAANAGGFEVEDPDGVLIGTGDVAAAFSAGGLAFTLADGGTDFAVGDGFNITVGAGSGKYALYDPDAANGTDGIIVR